MSDSCEHPEGFEVTGYSPGRSSATLTAHLLCPVCQTVIDRETHMPEAELKAQILRHEAAQRSREEATT